MNDSGELIEPSGTMSGGGKSCQRGRMGRNVATDTSGSETSAKDIALMEETMGQLSEQLAQLRQSKLALEDSLAEINQSLRQGNTNLQKWKMEIKVTHRHDLPWWTEFFFSYKKNYFLKIYFHI